MISSRDACAILQDAECADLGLTGVQMLDEVAARCAWLLACGVLECVSKDVPVQGMWLDD
jgi:hypothetical protein